MKKPTDAAKLAIYTRTTPATARAVEVPDDRPDAVSVPSVLPSVAQAADGRPDLHLVRGSARTIVEAVAATASFATLTTALRAAGMTELLAGDGPFTLFAPTDRAFARLPEGVLDALLQDRARLKRVLTSHLVAGRVTPPQPGTPSIVTSVAGSELNVTVHNGTFRVNGARVVRPHVRAPNGMIRGIDTVLMRH